MRPLVRPLLLASLLIGACAEPPPPVAPAPPPTAPPPALTAAPAPPPPVYGSAEQLGGWIDAYVSAFGVHWGEAYSAEGYLAVAEDGKVLFQKGYGKANRESGAVAGPDTRFRIGSVTKQFTATAVLQLARKGLLKIEDPIRKYLPDFPATGDKITLHHLLTHTSGLPSYTDDEALMNQRDKAKTHAEVLASFKDKPLDFEPGSRFKYSNSGYFVLGMIVEKVSGKSYEDYLQENVLRPAGMTRTSTVDAPDAPDTAVGYEVDPNGQLRPAQAIDMSIPFSAGSLRSTAHDLILWDKALAGETLLDEASKKRMHTPEKDGYAYGWSISKEEGKQVIAHSGGIDGFSSYIARVPEAKLVVVALSNNVGFDAAQMARPALRMVLSGKRIEPKPERAIAATDALLVGSFTGDYAITDDARRDLAAKAPAGVVESVLTIAVTAEQDHLFFKPVGQPRLQIFRGEDGALFTKEAGIEFTIEAGDKPGAPAKGFVLKQGGLSIHYLRAKAEAKKPATAAKKPVLAKKK